MRIALEDFAAFTPEQIGIPPDAVPLSQAESAKAMAYEQGYKAGWDDAVNSDSQEQARIGSEFARHLQEMSISFHEARTHVIQSVEPLIQELLETFLPALIRDTMGARITETLYPILENCAESPVQILIADGSRGVIEPHLKDTGLGVFELLEEPTLAEGQAFVKIGKTERQIDLNETLEQLRASLRSLSELNEKALEND